MVASSNDDYDDDAAWSAVSTSASATTTATESTTSTSVPILDDTAAGADSEAALEASEDDESILRDDLEFRRRLIDQSWPQTATQNGGGLGRSSLATKANQTGARLHQDQNINQQTTESASFVTSFFSHIDKQWKSAEIVLIIVISAILNLVTIVGNIMVLISFKMDRS